MQVTNQILKEMLNEDFFSTKEAESFLDAIIDAQDVKQLKEALYENRAILNKLTVFKAPNSISENIDELEIEFPLTEPLLELISKKRIDLEFIDVDEDTLVNLQNKKLSPRFQLTDKDKEATKQKAANHLYIAHLKQMNDESTLDKILSSTNIQGLKAQIKGDNKANPELITDLTIIKQTAALRLLELKIAKMPAEELGDFTHVAFSRELKPKLDNVNLKTKFSGDHISAFTDLSPKDLLSINILAAVRKKLIENPSEAFFEFLLKPDFKASNYIKEMGPLPQRISQELFDAHFAIPENRILIQEQALWFAVKEKLFSGDDYFEYQDANLLQLQLNDLASDDETKIKKVLKDFNILCPEKLNYKGLGLKALVDAYNAFSKKDITAAELNQQTFKDLPDVVKLEAQELALRQFIRNRNADTDKDFLQKIAGVADVATLKKHLKIAGIQQVDWLKSNAYDFLDSIKKEALLSLVKEKVKDLLPEDNTDNRPKLLNVIENLPLKALLQLYNDELALKKLTIADVYTPCPADVDEKLFAELVEENKDKILSINISAIKQAKIAAGEINGDDDFIPDQVFIEAFLSKVGERTITPEELLEIFKTSQSFESLFNHDKLKNEPNIKRWINPSLFSDFKEMVKQQKAAQDKKEFAASSPTAMIALLKQYRDEFAKKRSWLSQFAKNRDTILAHMDGLTEDDFIKLALSPNAQKILEKLNTLSEANNEMLAFFIDMQADLIKYQEVLSDAAVKARISSFKSDDERKINQLIKNLKIDERIEKLQDLIDEHDAFHKKLHGNPDANQGPHHRKGLIASIEEASRFMFRHNTTTEVISINDKDKLLKEKTKARTTEEKDKDDYNLMVGAEQEDVKENAHFRAEKPLAAGQARLHTMPYTFTVKERQNGEIVDVKKAVDFVAIEERQGFKTDAKGISQPKIKMTLGAFPTDVPADKAGSSKAYFATMMVTKILSAMKGLPTKDNPLVIRGAGEEEKEKVAALYRAARYLGVDANAIQIKGNSGFTISSEVGFFSRMNSDTYKKDFESNSEIRFMKDKFAESKKESKDAKELSKQITGDTAKSNSVKARLFEQKAKTPEPVDEQIGIKPQG